MVIVKLDNTVHNSGYAGTLVTVNTGISSDTDINIAIMTINAILQKEGAMLPRDINIADALHAYNAKINSITESLYPKPVIIARDWLDAHSHNNIVLGIQSIWINTSTKSWFANYWIIPCRR